MERRTRAMGLTAQRGYAATIRRSSHLTSLRPKDCDSWSSIYGEKVRRKQNALSAASAIRDCPAFLAFNNLQRSLHLGFADGIWIEHGGNDPYPSLSKELSNQPRVPEGP